VAEARSLVSQGGLSALTFGALEKQLEFTRGVITHHFRDKEDIVHAVLESAIAEIDAHTADLVLTGERFEEKLEGVLRSNIEGFLDHPEATGVILAFWGGLSSDSHRTTLNGALFQGYRQQTETLLALGRKEGKVDPSLDAQAAASLVVGVVIGAVVQVTLAHGALDPENVILSAGRILIQGLRTPA
jgi:AcrR family transcriptional regulator